MKFFKMNDKCGTYKYKDKAINLKRVGGDCSFVIEDFHYKEEAEYSKKLEFTPLEFMHFCETVSYNTKRLSWKGFPIIIGDKNEMSRL